MENLENPEGGLPRSRASYVSIFGFLYLVLSWKVVVVRNWEVGIIDQSQPWWVIVVEKVVWLL